MVGGAQGPVPVAEVSGPVAGEAFGELFDLEQGHLVTRRVKGSNSGVLDLDELLTHEKRASAGL
ncbi:hypothetical protein GCM10009827_105220 [Dactylosporangium maewongense]|uniref:Uncharacterized protein n=1 Tax=Dactylosporangium maewongense TaxID=634393 RepID=A0ABP4NRZ5_9ACTN